MRLDWFTSVAPHRSAESDQAPNGYRIPALPARTGAGVRRDGQRANGVVISAVNRNRIWLPQAPRLFAASDNCRRGIHGHWIADGKCGSRGSENNEAAVRQGRGPCSPSLGRDE